MKQPFRVAVVGKPDARLEFLLAGLSPSTQPRVFTDWDSMPADFVPELAIKLPETPPCPDPYLAYPVIPWELDERFRSPEDLESWLLAYPLGPVKAPPQARILGRSPAMARVRGLLCTTAPSPHPLFLTGENGTGKDLAAVVAHQLSCRAAQPFVPVNCGAIPLGLAETEFFGCVRGAFTGAENRTGFCHQAMGGTLFLDEVGEMPLEVQAKLLRVLENKEIRRVGSSRVESSDFRLICATNRDLSAEVTAGRFREDLYYRINVLRLRMPPLRERKEDLALLSGHFLDQETQGLPRRVRVGRKALAKMMDYDWPGNLRQLRNVVIRAAVLYVDEELGPEHIDWEP